MVLIQEGNQLGPDPIGDVPMENADAHEPLLPDKVDDWVATISLLGVEGFCPVIKGAGVCRPLHHLVVPFQDQVSYCNNALSDIREDSRKECPR